MGIFSTYQNIYFEIYNLKSRQTTWPRNNEACHERGMRGQEAAR